MILELGTLCVWRICVCVCIVPVASSATEKQQGGGDQAASRGFFAPVQLMCNSVTLTRSLDVNTVLRTALIMKGKWLPSC